MSEAERVNLRKKPYKGVWQRCAQKETVRLAEAGTPEIISPHRVRMGVRTGIPRWMKLFNETMREIKEEYDAIKQETEEHLTKAS